MLNKVEDLQGRNTSILQQALILRDIFNDLHLVRP
jgi:hypothetical protein